MLADRFEHRIEAGKASDLQAVLVTVSPAVFLHFDTHDPVTIGADIRLHIHHLVPVQHLL
ncbi:hypothetical protein D3C71_2177510 [compost metagenome]